ncbi:NAD(P)-dependent oxidoreductase [Ottowia thiooxydans]|uniref:NAD(P)-dependent oxidoreductase n=1 Tax=Ottowia thiooxydans TaxID=219182 RepID=UPI000421DBDB|nr:NAD(P)-dependent oxidoreductase [Ottowia thiooxydans]
MKVVYWPNIPLGRNELIAMLQQVQGIELEIVTTQEEVARVLPKAEGLISANPSPEEAALIASIVKSENSLQWMHVVSSGNDGVPLCKLPPEVRTSNTPGATANAVGDHAIALLFALIRSLPTAWEQQRAQKWSKGLLSRRATSIEGKTVVILGRGAIGQYLAKVLAGFDVRIRFVSRSVATDAGAEKGFQLHEMRDALQGADILICAISLSDLTNGIVSEDALREMNPGSFLINVGRGPLVERHGLLRCLQDGHLQGAGLDVTDPEPLPEDDELWSAPNLIITPHYAGAGSKQAGQRVAQAAEDVIASELRRRSASS